MISYYVRALFVVTHFHAFHPSAFSLILSDYLQESNTHGVGLFAVKGVKAGDFTDIDFFGTFVLYDTTTEVHDAIAADGVPRYMVASMCEGGEVLCPHAALFLVPLPCYFWWYKSDPHESMYHQQRRRCMTPSRPMAFLGTWWLRCV